MGFFEALKNIATGQPVFKNDQAQPGVPQPQAASPNVSGGAKVLPQVLVERFVCTDNGPRMQCELVVQNYGAKTLQLEKIELLGYRDELGEYIRPGEERELQLNLGNRPTNTQNNECRIYYKDPGGDYFYSSHIIEFEQLADKTYTIKRFRFQPPIRDV